MKTRNQLRSQLDRFDLHYQRARDGELKLYVAKLCVLEACGWIEEALDVFYLRHASRLLNTGPCLTDIQGRIRRTYSFEYEKCRGLIEGLIGLVGIELLEGSMEPAKFFPMKASLSSLKDARNGLAHTHIAGVQAQVDAPSVTIARFDEVTKGLAHLNVCFRRSFP